MPFTLIQEVKNKNHQLSGILKSTILAAFSFLTALSVRDVFTKTLEALLPSKTNEKLLYIYFYAGFVILCTVLLAYWWDIGTDTYI